MKQGTAVNDDTWIEVVIHWDATTGTSTTRVENWFEVCICFDYF